MYQSLKMQFKINFDIGLWVLLFSKIWLNNAKVMVVYVNSHKFVWVIYIETNSRSGFCELICNRWS